MAEQKIDIRKIRDFSENLNDTFVFIKQNFKPLVVSFLTIAGFFLLASSILNGIYQGQVGGGFWEAIKEGRASRSGPSAYNSSFDLDFFTGTYFFYLALMWLGMSAMHVVIAAYMKLYAEKQNETSTTGEVWEVFKKYYLKVVIYTLPVFLLMMIGLLFCLVPGIYFWVVLLPFPIVIIIEDASFGAAWSRCFSIIKENFWMSFGIYLVVYLIYAFSSTIISSVFAGITGGLSYFTTGGDVVTTMGVVAGIMQAFTFIFYIVFYVSVILNYFTLVEKHDGTGILSRLEKLGDNTPGYNNIEEQY